MLKLVGKFGLTEVNYNDDLSTFYDRDYLLYLRYGLADALCDFYNHPFSAKGKLKEIETNCAIYHHSISVLKKFLIFMARKFEMTIVKQFPVSIVGGNGFGRYPIISREEPLI